MAQIILTNIQSPCKNCSKRSWDCHAKCKDYAEYVEVHNKDLEIKRRELTLRNALDEQEVKRSSRYKRNKR